MNRSRVTLVLLTAATLWACSSAQEDWNKANTANTVAAYQEYLSKHPTGEHSAEAGARLHSLQDDDAWSQAKQANTLDAYRDYLQKQPTGAHVKDAQDAVTTLQRAVDLKTAESTGTVAALQDFLKKYPTGAEADEAKAKLGALSDYRVQLASVKTEKQAQRERDHLRAKYGSILHDVMVAPASSGKGYGVTSGPMSQSEADSACGELKKAHQRCEVVKSETGKS
jgi:outer membrane protein assembly factor BamD (BamD/ComL family)